MNLVTLLRRGLLPSLFCSTTLATHAQNVGVGTLTPGEKLEVVGGNIRIKDSGRGVIFSDGTTQTTAATGTSFIFNSTGTQAGANFNIGGNGVVGGRLGIGTSSPSQALDVQGGILARSNSAISQQGAYLQWNRSGGDGETWLLNQQGGGGSNAGIRFGSVTTGNVTTEWARFLNNGSLGIGTIGPVTTLDVRTADNSAAITVAKTDGTAGALYFGNSNHGLKRGYSGGNDLGLYTTAGTLYLSANNTSTSQFALLNNGNVGIGTSSPVGQLANTATNVLAADGNGISQQGIGWVNTSSSGYAGLFYNANNTASGPGLAVKIASPNATAFNVSQGSSAGTAGTTLLHVNGNGNVGIGTSSPTQKLDVDGGILARSSNAISSQGAYLQWNRSGTGDGATWLLNQQGLGPGGIFFGKSDQSNNVTEWARFDSNGKMGIGTTAPGALLDVQGMGDVGINNFAFFRRLNNNPDLGSAPGNGNDVSIRASGPIMASEFYATSDRRLKTVLGLSDKAADMALLNRLRITDYTMRDRVAFGDRAFKKVIAQEVEAVLPQAVTLQTGFLPDVYATATAVLALPGDSLVQLTLPAGLPAGGATAGQRLKLLGATRTVLATVARPAAAGSRTLVVRRAQGLAGGEVFVYGLEYTDVRAVDYEALSMLNVSATQELARKVAALEAQNNVLKTKADAADTKAMQAATEATAAKAQAAQATATLETFEVRLRRLEASGAQAQR